MRKDQKYEKEQKNLLNPQKKEFQPFKNEKSFVMSSIIDDEEDQNQHFQLQNQKKEKILQMEREFQKQQKQYAIKHEAKKNLLQQEASNSLKAQEKKEQPKEEDDSSSSDEEIDEERCPIKQEKNMTPSRNVSEQLNQLDEQYERERKERLEQFIAEKKQEEIELESLQNLPKMKKKKRVIRIEVSHQHKEKMEKIIADRDNVFHNFDTLYELNPKTTIHFCGKILTKPTDEEIERSNELAAAMREKIKKNGENSGLQIILLGLKQEYEKDEGTSFIISKHSTPKTQLCTKILTSGFFEDLIQFTQHIENNEEWNYDSLYQDDEKKAEFRKWYIKQKAKQYNIDEDSIVITRLVEGCIGVQWITVNSADALNILKQNSQNKQLKLHRYFKHFQLSPEDFSPKGNMFYDDFTFKDERGGWPYYLPTYCKRYGLNVSRKYDNKNDNWLLMNKNPEQWAVAFHGVSSPETSYRNTKVLNSIISGLDKGEMLIAGGGQVYEFRKASNKPTEKVGRGIYCSPHVQSCLGYTTTFQIENTEYRLILQCRVKPQKIKVCQRKEDYWVINEPKDIRPYGILLIKQENRKLIKSAKALYGDEFRWQEKREESELQTET